MNYKYLAICICAAALTACNKTEVTPTAEFKVKVDPVITRATETSFESGDAIGLSIVKDGQDYASNAELVYDGREFSSDLIWYSGTGTSTLKAYFPYRTSIPESFTVAADQSTGISSSDFVSAIKEGVSPSANSVAMVFKHQLTRVLIRVRNSSGGALGDIVLKGVSLTAVIDGETLTASGVQGASEAQVTAYKSDASGTSYYAIVPPQTCSITVSTDVDGKPLEQSLVSTTLLPGNQYTINMVVEEDKITVVLSGDIENWNDGGDIAVEEALVYGGVTYKTVTLADGRKWMAENLRFVPSGKTPSSNPSDGSGLWYPLKYVDGTLSPATSAEDVEASGYLYDIPTAFGVDSIREDSAGSLEGARGICPDGWHIPTRAEVLALVGNSVSGSNIAAVNNSQAPYYIADGSTIERLNQAGWNWQFTGAVMRSNPYMDGRYSSSTIGNINAESSFASCASDNYILTSSLSRLSYSYGELSNISFFALKSQYNNNYPTGRVYVGDSSYLEGFAVRCIKDIEE